jgi:hypothetical protein
VAFKGWDNAKLLELQQRGYAINDPNLENKMVKPIPKAKRKYSSKEKSHIEFILIAIGMPFAKEYKFHPDRKYRFDWAIIEKMVAIEYEGIYSDKSGHTSTSGYNSDSTKYNLATIGGWRLLRYTAATYMSIANDLEVILNIKIA